MNAFASMVLPLPGGHCMRILCPPAAAISSPRFAPSCPLISQKSEPFISFLKFISVFCFYAFLNTTMLDQCRQILGGCFAQGLGCNQGFLSDECVEFAGVLSGIKALSLFERGIGFAVGDTV